jgi:ABC-type transport system involved in cytochrome c biogenesis permease subunit
MKEGFLIGGGLLFAGLMLEMTVGPVMWDAFAWPVNGVMMAFFLTVVTLIYLFRKNVYVFQFMGTNQAAVPTLAYVVLLTIIMGLTRQTVNGTWINNMLTFWPFVLIYTYMSIISGQVVLRRLGQLGQHHSLRDIAMLCFHLGLFVALTTATLGNADMQRLKMITAVGEPEWRAMAQGGAIKEMPLAIELKKFIMETYDNGSPKRFASEVQILTKSGKNIQTTIDVNKPAKVEGWKIYQYGYDTQQGPQSQISILELITDPWLPVVYTGVYMMLVGALLLFLLSVPVAQLTASARRYPKRALALGVVTVIVFFCIHHFMPILHSDTLVPALQSPWFVPHIIAYMIAYTLMGVAAIMAFYRIFTHTELDIEDTLVYLGIAFITVGMLFGALWAKEAWGHYWSWDPKETWAAITWFAYLTYIHYRLQPRHNKKIALCMLIVSFALLQMCWWGINFLPSAQSSSVHVYST